MTKKELQEYYWVRRNIRQLEEKLEELETEATRQTTRFTQQPKARSSKDRMADAVAEIVTIQEKMQEELEKSYKLLTRIEQAIESLPPREKYLIRARYIDCKTWEQIAVEMHYSWPHVHRIHSRALQMLA